MKVEEWMTKPVFSCRPETSMSEAARAMWDNDCGVLPVVDAASQVVGVITDRDLCMGAYTRGRTLRDLRVQDSMSKPVFSCRPSDSLEQAIRAMGAHRVRRVPVTDEQGKLLGLLSLNDLVRRIVSLPDARGRTSLSTQLIEALATISEPRGSRAGAYELSRPPQPETILAGATARR